MTVVACPHCRTRLTVTDDLAADGEVQCPKCGTLVALAPPAPVAARPSPRAGRPTRARPVDEPAADKGAPGVSNACATLGCFLLVVFGCCGGCGIWSEVRQRALDDLAAADRLYAEGKKAEAVAKYKDRYSFVPDGRKAEVVKRVADHEATAGDKAEARRWVEKGLDAKLDIKYESPAARDILAQVHRERAEAEATKQAEAEKRQAEAAQRKTDDEERRKGVRVTTDQLRREYAADRKAADAKYKGKTLRVSGPVREYIAPEPDIPDGNKPILWLHSDVEPWIWCTFPLASDAQVRGLRPGQSVTVRGTCDGIFTGQINLTGCSLEP